MYFNAVSAQRNGILEKPSKKLRERKSLLRFTPSEKKGPDKEPYSLFIGSRHLRKYASLFIISNHLVFFLKIPNCFFVVRICRTIKIRKEIVRGTVKQGRCLFETAGLSSSYLGVSILKQLLKVSV